MNFDEVLSSVGNFGRYQKWLLALVCAPAGFFSAFVMYSHIFVSAVPRHHCKIPITADKVALLNNSILRIEDYELVLRTLFIPRDDQGRFDQCQRYAVDVDSVIGQVSMQLEDINSSILDEFSARNRWPFVECRDAWEFDTTEFTETLATKFGVICEQEWLVSIAQSAFFVGGVIGTIAFGWISDKWGRRTALLLSTALMVFGNLAAIAPPNYPSYMFIRFVIGLTHPSVYNIAFVIVAEMIGINKRTATSAICDLAYSVGMMLLAFAAYFIHHWRVLQVAFSLPMLLLIGFYWWLPESARWLASQSRVDDAEVIVQKIAHVNGVPVAPDFLKTNLAKDSFTVTPGDEAPIHVGLSQLFNYPRVTLKVAVIVAVWTVNGMVVHGMGFVAPILPSKLYLAFFLSAVSAIPGIVLAWASMQHFGRRSSMLGGLFLSGVFTLATAFVPDDIPWLAVLFPSLARLCASFTFTVCYVFAGEVLPTVIRSFAIGLSSTGSQLAMVVTPHIIYMANIRGRAVPFLIYGVLALLAGVLVLILPETLNAPLPRTLDESERYEDFVKKNTKQAQPEILSESGKSA